MHPTRLGSPTTALLFSLIAAQAAAQAPSPLTGSDAARAAAPGALIPALAFELNGAFVLQDVEVSGSFPERFRLEDAPAPPEAVLAYASAQPGKGGHVLGTLVAVPRDHPPVVQSGVQVAWRSRCSEASDDPHPCREDVALASAESGAEAFVSLRCDALEEDCTVSAVEGDPDLLARSLSPFAGRVADVQVLYVEHDAGEYSVVAQDFPWALPPRAGYHLVTQRERSLAVRRVRQANFAAAEAMTIAYLESDYRREFRDFEELAVFMTLQRYNARQQTAHTSTATLPPGDPHYQALRHEVQQELEVRRLGRELADQARRVGPRYARRAPPARAHELTLTMGAVAPRVGDTFPYGSPWRAARELPRWR